MMKLPIYCTVGMRPVKVVSAAGGGMDVLAYDWDTRQFVPDLSCLNKVTGGKDEDVDYMSQKEFEQYVTRLKQDFWL